MTSRVLRAEDATPADFRWLGLKRIHVRRAWGVSYQLGSLPAVLPSVDLPPPPPDFRCPPSHAHAVGGPARPRAGLGVR